MVPARRRGSAAGRGAAPGPAARPGRPGNGSAPSALAGRPPWVDL